MVLKREIMDVLPFVTLRDPALSAHRTPVDCCSSRTLGRSVAEPDAIQVREMPAGTGGVFMRLRGTATAETQHRRQNGKNAWIFHRALRRFAHCPIVVMF
jgi:hypothetical protein